jgi:gliding motility-associated-like protein
VFTTSTGNSPYLFYYTENGSPFTANSPSGGSPAVKQLSTATVGKIPYMLTAVRDANCIEQLSKPDTLQVFPLPDADIAKDVDVCRQAAQPVIIFSGNSGTPSYTFGYNINSGVNTSVTTNGVDSLAFPVSTDNAGKFTYNLTKVTDANTCSRNITGKSATVTIHEVPQAIFTISPEKTTILEPTINISNLSISATSWMWNLGDGSTAYVKDVNSHTYADTGSYTIKLVTYNNVCKDSTYLTVKVELPLLVYVPNSFSPNGDGINDVFKAEGDGFSKFDMMIFDRWGNMIFHSDDINKGWDGKANGGSNVAQIDAYIYVIHVKAFSNKHDYDYRGVFNLLK